MKRPVPRTKAQGRDSTASLRFLVEDGICKMRAAVVLIFEKVCKYEVNQEHKMAASLLVAGGVL